MGCGASTGHPEANPPAAAAEELKAREGRVEKLEEEIGLVKSELDRTRKEAGEYATHLDGEVESSKASMMETAEEVKAQASPRRTRRTGIWFVVHETHLKSVVHKECVDIDAEFLAGHPNRVPEAAGFHAVRLSDEQIDMQQERIRMSSYRWQDVHGKEKGRPSIPKNYGWFLMYVKEHGLIGWIDWVANVAVGVETTEVIGYMGGLYARLTVYGNWCALEPLGEALKRGWMYQEMAFCRLDEVMVDTLLAEVEKVAEAVAKSRPDMEAVEKFIESCGLLGCLLHRRAWDRLHSELLTFDAENPREGVVDGHEVDHPLIGVEGFDAVEGAEEDIFSEICSRCAQRLPMPGTQAWFSVITLFKKRAIFRDMSSKVEAAHSALKEMLCASPYAGLATFKDFIAAYAPGIGAAALSTQLSFEDDRFAAMTSVSCAIARETYGRELDATELLEKVWGCDEGWESLLGQMNEEMPHLVVSSFGAAVGPGDKAGVLTSLKLQGALVALNTVDEKGEVTGSYQTEDGSTVEDFRVNYKLLGLTPDPELGAGAGSVRFRHEKASEVDLYVLRSVRKEYWAKKFITIVAVGRQDKQILGLVCTKHVRPPPKSELRFFAEELQWTAKERERVRVLSTKQRRSAGVRTAEARLKSTARMIMLLCELKSSRRLSQVSVGTAASEATA